MFTAIRPFRLLLGVTTSLSLVLPAVAQNVVTPTPPARVGQLAGISGSVSFNGAGSNNQWVAATANYPVSSGDSVFTQDGAQAALVVDSSRLTLAPNTELQVTALDSQNLTATQSQGEVFLRLEDLQPGQSFTLNTPRGAVSIGSDGEYDIAAGDANNPTTVAVLSGAATIGQLQVPAGQEGYLSGTDSTTAQLGAIQRDDFMNRVLAEMAPPPPPYAPPVVQQMTGVDELSSYGSWDQSPQYGAIWYPSVDSGWAPYREGHWAFVAPWGWTWVDVEPWGFAPFHYGRWIQDDGRWGWVPAGAYAGGGYGPDYRPVYAPAVVGFFGLGAGVAITAAILSSGSVGWVPLAPGEAYHPYYHADEGYIRNINRVDVRNYTQINNNITINHYANRRGATYIPASAMAHGDPVGHYGRPMGDDMFAHARPMQGDFNQSLRPDISHRAAPGPQLTDFAQRRDVPPAIISHEPMQPGFHPQNEPGRPDFARPDNSAQRPGEPFHPLEPGGPLHAPGPQIIHPQGQEQQFHPQQPQIFRPQEPAYRPEVPQQQFHPQMPQVIRPQEPAEQFHPPAPDAYRPPPAFHPQPQFQPQQPFHPQMPQVIRPQEPAEQFHPPAPDAYRPPPAFHPQPQFQPQQQFHPQAQFQPQQQFHPQAQFHPEQAPRPQEAPRPQGGQPEHRPN